MFFKSEDPKELVAWYKDHLGIQPREDGTILFEWREKDTPAETGYTVWAPFPKDTKYFGPSEKPFMFNLRVDDLEALLKELRAAGVTVDDRVEDLPYGKFGWIMDPEGNRVELWEPKPLPKELEDGS